MKIRTILFLFFLPPIIATNVALGGLLSYWSFKEAKERHFLRVKKNIENFLPQLPQNSDSPNKNLLVAKRYKDLENVQITTSHSKDIPYWKEGNLFLLAPYSKDGKKMIEGYYPLSKEGPFLYFQNNMTDVFITLQQHILVALISIFMLIILASIFLFTVSKKISKPVKKLTNCALSIAAGEYGTKIEGKGPKEVVDLANTLNTMSECLEENINNLKENSLLREKMYGKYESALLFQQNMLDQVIENCDSDAIAINSISFFSSDPKGLLLHFPKNSEEDLLSIQVIEAKEKGFEGMYELLTHHKLAKSKKPKYSHSQVDLDLKRSLLSFHNYHHQRPILWSFAKKELMPLQPLTPFSLGDYFFLHNEALKESCPKIESIISKVMRVFGEEGLEAITDALRRDISFLRNKNKSESDLHLICFQILSF